MEPWQFLAFVAKKTLELEMLMAETTQSWKRSIFESQCFPGF